MVRMSWEAARTVASERARPLPASDVSLPEALGSTLAEPLSALAPLPSYGAAAMDGYAVAGRPPWTVTGRVLAGVGGTGEPLREGEAVEVATGAAVPEGTSAVLPYEQAHRDGETAKGQVQAGRHVRSRGEDCQRDEELLPAGQAVTPAVLGLAASVGHDELRVRRGARVAILVTGDELTGAGMPRRGQVRDAIGPMVPGMVRAWSGRPHRPARLPDDSSAILDALTVVEDADVVALCGASSHGPADHLRKVLAALRADVLVDGVACRPGHPQLLARAGGRFVVGLPGNPYAALVAALTLLAPLLTALAGRPASSPARAEVEGCVTAHHTDTRLVAVRTGTHGRSKRSDVVVPVGHDRPALLWGAALADAVAVVPPHWDGGEVELLPLPTR